MIYRLWSLFIGLILLSVGLVGLFVWGACRIYVPENMCAVLTRKTGETLPPGQLVATSAGQKGIQEATLGPGRHFRNPFTWGWELKSLTVIPAGDPHTWEWVHSLDAAHHNELRSGSFHFRGEFPQVGVLVRKVGIEPGPGEVIVPMGSGKKGIIEEVLTPGTYRLNPAVYDIELHPAVVIPSGFVGVVTNLFGAPPTASGTNRESTVGATAPDGAAPAVTPAGHVDTAPMLANVGERGTLRDVLQPGIYFINPRLRKVTLIEIGFNEYSQVRVSEHETNQIAFPSDTGYSINVGVTVVWGIDPAHAAETINEFGNIDGVIDKVISPQLRSICRNIGSTYAARDFIQGEKREQFQRDMTSELRRICRQKHIEVLLALVREIEVHAPGEGKGEGVEDLKRTIQQSHIAIESQLTKAKQRDAATSQAALEEERKKVEIARESIASETRVVVAKIIAEGEKQAAETDAQASLEVAAVQEEVARLDAQRIEILGKARADVDRMKRTAEATGYELLVRAFGSGQAYNMYTFAENFDPKSIRLFFAGEGTFWTDLTRFEEVGAAKLLQPETPERK